MVYRFISEDYKQRCLALIEGGMSHADTAHLLDVSERSTYLWKRNYKIYGHVVPPRLLARGPLPKLSPQIRDDIYLLLKADPTLYLDEILDWMRIAYDQDFDDSLLSRGLKDMNLSMKRVKNDAAQRDEVDRTEFRAYCRANFLAEHFVFTDESSKDGRTSYRRYGRALTGQRAQTRNNFERGERWSILPAMTIDGYIAMRMVPESVDGVEFLDFVINDVVCSLRFGWYR